jgi:uncharacterized membrane protein YbhN (UPF0104 family)
LKIRAGTIGRIIYYASLLFLLLYLVRSGIFSVTPERIHLPYLLLSVLFVCGGFLLEAWTWYLTLNLFSETIPFPAAVRSSGRPVFAKYIPGKIWIILGRASAAAESGADSAAAGFASLLCQAISVNTGLLTGSVLLFVSSDSVGLRCAAAILMLVLSVLMLSPAIQKKLFRLYGRLLKKEITVREYTFPDLLKVCAVFLLLWLVWGTGFFFLLKGLLTEISFSPEMLLVFPLSATVGIISVFAPGGLGVREGIMAGVLVYLGLTLESAGTVSLAARVWFLAGEVFIFGLSWLFKNPVADQTDD